MKKRINNLKTIKSRRKRTVFGDLLQLLLTGIGIGIISGSVIKNFEIVSSNSSKNYRWNEISFSVRKRSNNSFNTYKDSKEDLEISLLSERWRYLANNSKDLQASGYLLFLSSGEYAELSSSEKLSAASTIKIPILLALLKMVDSNQIAWNEKLILTKEVIGGGAGWMAYQPLGTSFPLHEVATEMIRISDNTATNLIIKRLGGIDKLNQQFKDFGLHSTVINNLLPDLKGTNITSAKDLAIAIGIADAGNELKINTRDLFREVMRTSKTNRLLPGGFLKGLGLDRENPDLELMIKGYHIYNKTGDIGIAYADAALIEMPDNSRAVAAFIVKGPFNDPRSAELIRDMAASMAPIMEERSAFSANPEKESADSIE